MTTQSLIDSRLDRIKKWYWEFWPLCLFCNHRVKEEEAQLAHIIRKSQHSKIYSREELITMKLNTGLAHHDCHEIADNDPEQAIYLPRFIEVHFLMWLIDPEIFSQVAANVYPLYEFPDFTRITDEYALHWQDLQHHGELLYLPYDI